MPADPCNLGRLFPFDVAQASGATLDEANRALKKLMHETPHHFEWVLPLLEAGVGAYGMPLVNCHDR